MVYDKITKGFVLDAKKFEIPEGESEHLNSNHPNVCFQMRVKSKNNFKIELFFETDQNNLKRLIFSTNFKELSVSFFHIQIPIAFLEENVFLKEVVEYLVWNSRIR